jgi:hypothetical protein
MALAGTIRAVGLAACALLAGLSAAYAAVEKEAPGPKPPARPVVRRIGPQLFQVGTVQLDAKARTIRCKGHVAMSEGGPLDLLACTPTGKAYESIFTLDVRPMDLQVALLLLGLTPGRNPAYKYQPDDPGADQKPGDEVLLNVEWTPKPKPQDPAKVGPPRGAKPAPPGPPAPAAAPPARMRVPAEQFLFNRQTEQPLEDVRWAFLGSTLTNGRFGADLEGSLIATYHDPLSILELAHPLIGEDQYQNMDYSINSKLCPPVGTPIELVIELPHKDEQPAPAPSPGKTAPAAGTNKEDAAHAQDKP